jgi:simple sugar transport system permease protein
MSPDTLEAAEVVLVDRRTVDWRNVAVTLGVPIAAVVASLLVGAVLILLEGSNPIAVYIEVLRGVFVENRGLRNTATGATPLILMGVGLAIAYRSSLYTIGAEGQYVIGAVAATGWATSDGMRDLPTPVLIVGCLLVAAVAGAVWSCICAVLNARFGTNIVIASLLLTYVALAVMQWAIRVGIRDPDSFIPASRVIGDAALPTVPVLNTHLGFVIAVSVVPILSIVMARTRFGYRVDVLGHNPAALTANEAPQTGVMFGVLALVGVLSGIAGYIQVAGVTQRINGEFSVNYGFTAILVALLGRLHLIGVLVAALGLAGLTVGLDVAERAYDLPSSLTGVLQALIIIFVVLADAIVGRSLIGRSRSWMS